MLFLPSPQAISSASGPGARALMRSISAARNGEGRSPRYEPCDSKRAFHLILSDSTLLPDRNYSFLMPYLLIFRYMVTMFMPASRAAESMLPPCRFRRLVS